MLPAVDVLGLTLKIQERTAARLRASDIIVTLAMPSARSTSSDWYPIALPPSSHRLELAARNLGATPFTAFRRITLPLIRPGLIVGVGDPTDRFSYWPVRIARGGEVLAPGGTYFSQQVGPASMVELSEAELDALIAYLQNLGTANKKGN